MKKIMIVAAMVCAAAFAQAACIDWSINNNAWTLKNGSKAAKGFTVYLINGDTSLATIESAISAGTITSASWYYGSATTGNTKGYVANTTATSGNLTAGTSYNFSALFVSGTDYMVSATIAQNAYDPAEGEKLAIGFTSDQMNDNSQTGDVFGNVNGWVSISDVPEPTSAMLLLLGMAGLALKRKRA